MVDFITKILPERRKPLNLHRILEKETFIKYK